MPGIHVSPEKTDPKVSNGQNRETNNDINEPTNQSPQQQQLMSSAKPVNTPVSDKQPSLTSFDPSTAPQQQGTNSEPSNISASQNTNVSTGSAHPEPPHTSSGVPVGMFIIDWMFCSVSWKWF